MPLRTREYETVFRVRSADQLRSHPLRGAIFETWVVSEIMKHRANGGVTGRVSFCRDKDGVEADLVIEDGGRLVVVEAKPTATASTRLFDGAARVRGLLVSTGW